jgi:hypothetical protein
VCDFLLKKRRAKAERGWGRAGFTLKGFTCPERSRGIPCRFRQGVKPACGRQACLRPAGLALPNPPSSPSPLSTGILDSAGIFHALTCRRALARPINWGSYGHRGGDRYTGATQGSPLPLCVHLLCKHLQGTYRHCFLSYGPNCLFLCRLSRW